MRRDFKAVQLSEIVVSIVGIITQIQQIQKQTKLNIQYIEMHATYTSI